MYYLSCEINTVLDIQVISYISSQKRVIIWLACHVAVVLSDHERSEVLQYTIASHSSYPKSAHTTLTQFANKLSLDLDRLNNDASISLCLLPGNNTLDKKIFVAHIKKFPSTDTFIGHRASSMIPCFDLQMLTAEMIHF